jgi:hypothetical protein
MPDPREIARALTRVSADLFQSGWEQALLALGLQQRVSKPGGRAYFDWHAAADVEVTLDEQRAPERVSVILTEFDCSEDVLTEAVEAAMMERLAREFNLAVPSVI